MNLFYKLCGIKWATVLIKVISTIIPNIARLKKYKNLLITPYFISFHKSIIKNNPIFIQLAPTSICNYRCLFCEIHKDSLLHPKRVNNMFTLENLKNYEGFLSTVYKLVFSGGTAEPLLNQNFGRMTKYLKKRYGTRMTVNTNGSMIAKPLAYSLVEMNFDKLLVSYHAGSKEGYKNIMTGDVERVDENLKYLKKLKNKFGKRKPEIQFNFALQKLNAKEYPFVIDKIKDLGIDSILISKYYGGRNKLQDQNVAFDYHIEDGNRVLDEIYDYAEEKKVRLSPPKPSYWFKENIRWDPNNYDANKKCLLPWIHLHFKPVLDDRNSHYVGVCNRTELFKVNYDVLNLKTKEEFDIIWNHPILQYLRTTVNEKDNINPICKYCKNMGRWTLRNINATEYARIRDEAMRDFFIEFHKRYPFEKTEGIVVLTGNPYSDSIFKDKLKKLEEI